MYDYTKLAAIVFYNVIQALFFCLLVLLALLFHPYEKSALR